MADVQKFVTGPIETNSYLLVNERNRCIVVDPSSGCHEITAKISRDSLTVEAVVLTHGHFDHIMGVGEILEKASGIPVYIHPDDASALTDPGANGAYLVGAAFAYTGKTSPVTEGMMTIGSFTFNVLHIPGHTPGGCVFLIEKFCICGDVLFAGSIGRSDLPGGDGELLIRGLKEKLLPLPDETIVCPGHGGRTTIARERRSNPYLS